jgi:glycosyltransferase involved in cell wall biosynthesis
VQCILFAGHSPTVTTGYGRVVRRLAHAFRGAGHEVAAAGFGYNGEPHELPYPVFKLDSYDSPERLSVAVHEFSPDVLLTLSDPWTFKYVPQMAQRRSFKWIAYFPLDGRPFPEDWKAWLADVDVPVVLSKFTQECVAEATGRTPVLIYHGVDTHSFKPMDRQHAKELAHVAGHFVVGCVARNQQRKNLPALVKAFAKFAADKPDAILYLHTQVRGHWDLYELVKRFGVEDKTRVTEGLGTDRGVPDTLLATVYNAMDVFVLPTMGEGFGLPLVESQACGTPALATDYSACPELLADPIQRLKVKDTLIMGHNFEQAVVDTDDIVEKIEHFYRNPLELRERARWHQLAQGFEWAEACRPFVELLESVKGDGGSDKCTKAICC